MEPRKLAHTNTSTSANCIKCGKTLPCLLRNPPSEPRGGAGQFPVVLREGSEACFGYEAWEAGYLAQYGFEVGQLIRFFGAFDADMTSDLADHSVPVGSFFQAFL